MVNDMTLNSQFLSHMTLGGAMTHEECHDIELTVSFTHDIERALTHDE